MLVTSPRALRPLLREYTALFGELPPVEALEAVSAAPELAGRFRLLPCSHVGGMGLLPIFRPEQLRLGGKSSDELLIAVSPHAHGDGYKAIL